MADANTNAERSETDAEGVHRLRDIVVEEVSLVDRPANQRRFLIVKRSDEDQTRRTTDKAKKKPAPNDEAAVDEQKAAKKPFGTSQDDDDEDEEDTEKARGSRDDDEDEDAEDAEKARWPGDDDEDDDDDEDESDDTGKAGKRKQQRTKGTLSIAGPAKAAVLSTVTKALERLMTLAKRVQGAAEPEGNDVAGVPDVVGAELGAIAELLSTEQRKSAPTDVAKAGARMAKDRLAKFQQALNLLASILTELTGAQAAKQKAAVSKRDPTAPPALEIPGLADLVSGIGELTSIVKRQEAELAQVRKSRTASNAIPVEGNRRAAPDVSWPLDMNRPISRDKVRKDTSFFDE